MDIVKTGIPGLDDILGGGIPFGSVVTVGGEIGTGKTLLATQFLYNGIMEFDEPGIYLSFEEKKANFYSNMKCFGWDLLKLEKEKKFLFIEFPSYEVEQFLTQEEIIHEFIDEMEIERMVFDPITPFGMAYSEEWKRREAMQKLFDKFRSWLCTTIVLGEGNQSVDHVPKNTFEPEKLSDGYIFLYSFLKNGNRQRALEVIKMRGVRHGHRLYETEITEKGLLVHAKKEFLI